MDRFAPLAMTEERTGDKREICRMGRAKRNPAFARPHSIAMGFAALYASYLMVRKRNSIVARQQV
jgi:hypothetical protein